MAARLSKEVSNVISNALIAFGSIALSAGFALPYAALAVFVDYPDNHAAQERANGYAQIVNFATWYFLAIGGIIFLAGVGLGLAPYVKVRTDAKIAIVAAFVFVIGGILVYLMFFKPH